MQIVLFRKSVGTHLYAYWPAFRHSIRLSFCPMIIVSHIASFILTIAAFGDRRKRLATTGFLA